MRAPLSRLALAAITTGSLAMTGILAASPAHAALTDGFVYGDGTVGFTSGCTSTDLGTGPSDKPLTDNGVAVSESDDRSATITRTSTPTDITDVRISSHFTAVSTPITGRRPATLKVAGSSRATIRPRLSTSSCEASARAYGESGGDLALPAGMWATISGSVTSPGGGDFSFYLRNDDDAARTISARLDPSAGTATATSFLPTGTYLDPSAGTVTARLFLPAGTYSWESEAYSQTDGPNTLSTSTAGRFTVSLTPAGYASPVSGKGRKYVALGGRSCTTDSIGGALTRAVKKAKKVSIKVNGRTRATLTGRELHARSFALTHLAPGSGARVVATITPKRGKKVTVSRSYLACR